MAIRSFTENNSFLSSMYPFENGIRTPDGEVVHTSEQLYLPPRLLEREARIVVERADDGHGAKRLFRTLVRAGSPVRPDWDEVKVDKMRDCVMVKFAANPDIAQALLDTGDEELIEGNDRGDTFWGVAPMPPHGTGENMLGRILMETRDALRQPDFSVDVDELVKRIFNPITE